MESNSWPQYLRRSFASAKAASSGSSRAREGGQRPRRRLHRAQRRGAEDETVELRERYEKGETLDDLLPEAFAAVREAAKRTLGMRHFDVQLMGGAALHLGNIAEMKTGEGKTLVATLAGLPQRDRRQGRARRHGQRLPRDVPVGAHGPRLPRPRHDDGRILSGQTPDERREQYAADITYGTNNEFGFDYLRDNMAWQANDMVQRGHFFAVVDEVDSILIDEARTPLIISGPGVRRGEPLVRRVRRHRQRLSPAKTTRSTRRSAPSACSSPASRRSRTTSASTTSTSRRTPRSSRS